MLTSVPRSADTRRIAFSTVRLGPQDEAAVVEALRSSWISGGSFVDRLEARMAERAGVRHALAVNNGTSAIEAVLRGYGIGAGDEVLVSGYAFFAAASMIAAVGARPVFVDAEEAAWGMDISALRRAITPRSKAIIAVHPYGPMLDMRAIRAAADEHGLRLIEDAAEAVFSSLDGVMSGAWGHAGTYSFHATKTLTTGEGGMVVTNDSDLAARIDLIRSHGRDPSGPKYWHSAAGHNFRLSNMLAALGCAQLDRYEAIVQGRERVAGWYRERLARVPGLHLQPVVKGCVPVYWAVAAKLDDAIDRDAVLRGLEADGIEARPGFYPASLMPAIPAPPLPVSERLGRSILVLPTHLGLSEADVARVCDSLAVHIAAAEKPAPGRTLPD